MPERLLNTLRLTWPILVVTGGFLIWGARLEVNVSQKADRAEVREAEGDLKNELRQLDSRTMRIEAMVTRLVCRDNPNDMSCP